VDYQYGFFLHVVQKLIKAQTIIFI